MTAYLLDTHVVIWAVSQPSQLSAKVRDAMEDGDSQLFVSPVSAMEIATKYRLGKLQVPELLVDDFAGQMDLLSCEELPLRHIHGRVAGSLPFKHGDPFDRLLIAQAQVDSLRLVSRDRMFDRLGVKRFW